MSLNGSLGNDITQTKVALNVSNIRTLNTTCFTEVQGLDIIMLDNALYMICVWCYIGQLRVSNISRFKSMKIISNPK